jgi:hypothetical protein
MDPRLLAGRTGERLTIFESRQYFSIPVSRVKPTPPVHSIACPETRCATTLAQYFAMAASLVKAAPFLSPCGIVREKSHALKFDRSLRNRERHALEGAHWLSGAACARMYTELPCWMLPGRGQPSGLRCRCDLVCCYS